MKREVMSIAIIAGMFLSGCILDFDESGDSGQSNRYLVVTTADFVKGLGNVSVINTSSFKVADDLLSIHSDNAVVTHGSSIYILERLGADNIIRADNPDISSSSLAYQKNIGTAVNIHDIAIVSSTKAYVTQNSSANLAVVNPATGTVTSSVALNAAAYIHGGETVPYMSSIVYAGGYVYVACQRLKTVQGQWGPYADVGDSTGVIVVIDVTSNRIVSSIALNKKNPASLATVGGYLYVSSTGSWMSQTDGGIEKINLSTNANEGVVISEGSFGGDITTLETVSATKAYVCVGKYDADFNFTTEVHEFNLSTGAVAGKVPNVKDAFGGLAHDGTYLYIGDRDPAAPGVIVIDPTDNSVVAGPISVGALPPSSIACAAY